MLFSHSFLNSEPDVFLDFSQMHREAQHLSHWDQVHREAQHLSHWDHLNFPRFF
jgi:hypothetical protein